MISTHRLWPVISSCSEITNLIFVDVVVRSFVFTLILFSLFEFSSMKHTIRAFTYNRHKISKREFLLAQIRQRDQIIKKLLETVCILFLCPLYSLILFRYTIQPVLRRSLMFQVIHPMSQNTKRHRKSWLG